MESCLSRGRIETLRLIKNQLLYTEEKAENDRNDKYSFLKFSALILCNQE